MIIGAQGYTIRDFAKDEQGIETSLKKLRKIGYRCLQVSAFGKIAPQRLRELCDEQDIQIIVTHTDPQRILGDTMSVIREHEILGCRHVGIGAMPERYRGSLEGTRAFLRDFSPAAKLLREHGMKLQYHNHWFEYQKEQGQVLFDVMVQETDPREWGFILDVYWTQFGGRCPAEQIARLAGRIDVCHFKDMAIHGKEQRFAPVMEGNLCWEEILDACQRAKVPYAMVEQDDAYGKDPFEELAVSVRNLKAAGAQF